MKKTDRRIRKTKTALREGFARLIAKKSIKEITVKELVEEVDINRSTFYLHYTDINNMLKEIEDELVTEFERVIELHRPSKGREETLSFFYEIYDILKKNKSICLALISENGDILFQNRIENLIAKESRNYIEENFSENNQDFTYVFNFCASGCIGLFKKWLNEDGEESVKHMAEITTKMVLNTIGMFSR